jgi:hypothetical protein
MGQGISAVLTYAIGVAISPVPIIAVKACEDSWPAEGGCPFSAVVAGCAGASAAVDGAVAAAAG